MLKYAAIFNCAVAFASMLNAIYYQELTLAGAWASSMLGWLVAAIGAWRLEHE